MPDKKKVKQTTVKGKGALDIKKNFKK